MTAAEANATETNSAETHPGFAGRRVLIPRGGNWGDNVSSLVRELGGVPVVVPLVKFAPPLDEGELVSALEEVEAGEYDWVTVTSVATVGVLSEGEVFVPSTTQLAAVGTATGDALEDAGFHVSLTPTSHVSSAQTLATELIELLADEPARILVLHSDLASPVLSDALTDAGHDVNSVIAYRTVPVEANAAADELLMAAGCDAVLLTSGSIAAALLARFPALVVAHADEEAEETEESPVVFASIGPGTTAFAEHLGMRVAVTSETQNVEALVVSLAHYFEEPHV